MKLHELKMSKETCDKLIACAISMESAEETRGDRDGTPAFVSRTKKMMPGLHKHPIGPNETLSSISRTKGGIKESAAIKDRSMFADDREYLILKHYENHQESGYTNYTSAEIDALVPQEILDHFKLRREDCRIDVKRSSPGKIHIPHKDYYINYKYNLVDNNGNLEYVPKDSMNGIDVIRIWITLTEPRFGHVLVVEDTPFYYLEQGSIVTWETHELHTAANLGYEDRFIMTITGSICA